MKQLMTLKVISLIKSFDHVAVTVKDFDKTIDWYVTNLGFSVKRRIERKERGIRLAFLEVGGQVVLEFLGFIEPDKVINGPTLKSEETGIKHISFFVENMEDICQRLGDAGVEVTRFDSRAVFKDPNGIRIELRIS